MNLRDRWSGLFWLAISIFVSVESFRSDVGTFHAPGPGFFPLLASIVLGTFAIVLIVITSLKKARGREIKSLWKGIGWRKILLVIASLFVYGIFVPKLGYLLTTFGLMILLFSIIRRSRLWLNSLMALITVLATYIIFQIWLEVQLPKGILFF